MSFDICRDFEIFSAALKELVPVFGDALQGVYHNALDITLAYPPITYLLAPLIWLFFIMAYIGCIVGMVIVLGVLSIMHFFVKPIECLTHPLCCTDVEYGVIFLAVLALQGVLGYKFGRFLITLKARGEKKIKPMQEPLLPNNI